MTVVRWDSSRDLATLQQQETLGRLFHRIERSYGSFARTFTLPPTVDASKVSAQYKAGVLTVRLPLREEATPNRIKIAVAA